MEHLEEEKKIAAKTLVKYLWAWLVVSTVFFGLGGWFYSYQIFVKGANFTYWPAEDIEPAKKK